VDPILRELQQNARASADEIALRLNLKPADVAARIAAWEEDKTILGYHTFVDLDKAGNRSVLAFIQVKVKPEREGGFDRMARRICKFDQVTSCYLASGGSYDLLVIVESRDLREIAQFVAEKLSTVDGVVSTATHFQLKAYKQNGFLTHEEAGAQRLPVTP
jgi:DNA-binding Lrp family transcriptional regulator